MKKEFLKQNKGISTRHNPSVSIKDATAGITLIALVITIIVLLILAGVAISMLSGENGILTQAAKAKTEHEDAQANEENALIDMEVELDFASSETPYKFQNGYITGIEMSLGNVSRNTETVEQAKAKLPAGYEIYIDEDTKIGEDEAKTTNVKTGMIVKKNGNIIGTIIVYGDVNMDGWCTAEGDGLVADNIIKGNIVDYKECQLVAMNVNHDKEINRDDVDMIIAADSSETNINQSVEVKNDIKDIVLKNIYWYIHDYIAKRPENFVEKYNVYYNEEQSRYEFEMEAGTLTAAEFLEDLQDENAKFMTFNEQEGAMAETYDDTQISRAGRVFIKLDVFEDYEIIRITVK